MINRKTVIKIDNYELYSFESKCEPTLGLTLYGYRKNGRGGCPMMLGEENICYPLIDMIENAARDRFYAKNKGKSYGSWNKLMTMLKKNYESVCNEVGKQLKD